MHKDFYLVDIDIKTDVRGSLTAFEKDFNCPFEIKRVFCIAKVPNKDIIRANHINKNTSMVLIALQGNCVVECNKTEKVILNSPDKGIFIGKGVHRKLYKFSKNALVLCLCDNYYDKLEYDRE